MKPANCKVCGKIFLKANFDVCPDCIRKEQELIKEINDYSSIRDKITLEELAEVFNEPLIKLEKFLIDRKLVQIMDKLELTCKMCNKKFRILNEGRLYCKTCYEKLEANFGKKEQEDSTQGFGYPYK